MFFKILYTSFCLLATYVALSQINFIDISVKDDWRIDSSLLSNGNVESVYWDTIIIDGLLDVVNVGMDVKSTEGILLECFRRDTLMKSYAEAIYDEKGNCLQVEIVDLSHGVILYFHEDSSVKCIQNFEDGKKHGYSFWFNINGIIERKELYAKGVFINEK